MYCSTTCLVGEQFVPGYPDVDEMNEWQKWTEIKEIDKHTALISIICAFPEGWSVREMAINTTWFDVYLMKRLSPY